MNEEFAVLLFFLGISVTVNIALAVGALRAARRTRRLENHLLSPATAGAVRVERLEQVVDTLDARLEQIARGQEFLSNLMSERRHALSAREREVTPH